ncbi:MAG: TatD family hydrolase [Proteobacteria bacterium]|nr:TatD family hydrolase [Pseudomonadota bacterium]MDA1058618.1 TatD family hydrolase [Pseudomonadota bacterium]
MLVDSHCHLDFDALAGDRDGVLARARAAGVGAMLTIGTHRANHQAVREIAESQPDIWCSVGIHPHEADTDSLRADEIVALTKHPKVVAIGETGLDFYYDHSDRTRQAESFRAHCVAGRETGLPVIVHTRNADADTAAILREESGAGALKGVIHCFSATRDFATAALDLGFYISLSGIVTFKNATDIRETAKSVPADRLLVETDAPYLAPVPKRGKTNEPAYVAYTAAAVAALRGIDDAELAAITTANFFRLFDRATPPVGNPTG